MAIRLSCKSPCLQQQLRTGRITTFKTYVFVSVLLPGGIPGTHAVVFCSNWTLGWCCPFSMVVVPPPALHEA